MRNDKTFARGIDSHSFRGRLMEIVSAVVSVKIKRHIEVAYHNIAKMISVLLLIIRLTVTSAPSV